MERERCNFDEARRIQMERMFKAAGIGPDGLPIGERRLLVEEIDFADFSTLILCAHR